MALDLSALDAVPVGLVTTGTPVILNLSALTEDPDNPRTAFDAITLAALAEDIKQRGILQPIIVRPMAQGQHVIRFGARRYRAAQIAGLTQVPCFITTDTRQFDSYAQVAENEQRESLSPMELAAFVAKRLALGEKKKDIARGIDIPLPSLTYLLALIDPPSFLLEIFQSGKCTSLQYLYLLRKLHEQNPTWVERATGEAADITRAVINEITEAIQRQKPNQTLKPASHNLTAPLPGNAQADMADLSRSAVASEIDAKHVISAATSAAKLRYTFVRLTYSQRSARLLLTRRSSAMGQGWIQFLDDGSETEINLAEATLDALLEA